MSRNIGDEEPSPVGIDGDEPVEISCDGGHGTTTRAIRIRLSSGTLLGRIEACISRAMASSFSSSKQAAFVSKHFSAAIHPCENTNSATRAAQGKDNFEVEKSSAQIVMDDSRCQNQSPVAETVL